jgi:hypothetical protein
VVLIVVAAAIVVAVIAVALGRGGELGEVTADFAPFEIDDVTAADVALLRPPPSLCGYHIPATDQALSRIARTMTERDVEIATLRRQLAELRSVVEAHEARERLAPPEWPQPDAPGIPDPAPVPGPAGLPPVPGPAGLPPVPGLPAEPAGPGHAAAASVPGGPAAPAAAGPAGPAGASSLWPSRAGLRPREMTDPPLAPDTWPARAPWSAWERPAADSGLAAGASPGPAQDPEPDEGTDPAGAGGAW